MSKLRYMFEWMRGFLEAFIPARPLMEVAAIFVAWYAVFLGGVWITSLLVMS